MNAITTVFIAAALLTVCDVSEAAQPAAIKSLQPSTAVTPPRGSALADPVLADPVYPRLFELRFAARAAQQQILQETLAQNWRELARQPLAAMVPVVEEQLAGGELAAVQTATRQVASK